MRRKDKQRKSNSTILSPKPQLKTVVANIEALTTEEVTFLLDMPKNFNISEELLTSFLIKSGGELSTVRSLILSYKVPDDSIKGNPPFAFRQRDAIFIDGINIDQKAHDISDIWWQPVSCPETIKLINYLMKHKAKVELGMAIPIFSWKEKE